MTQPRLSEKEPAHSLTLTCFGGQPLLARDDARRWLSDAVQMALREHGFHLWAYAVVPDHAELLIWPTQRPYHAGMFLDSVKASVTRAAIAWAKEHDPAFLAMMVDPMPDGEERYRFWQPGGRAEGNIPDAWTLWGQIDYIHQTPVRAGLCERAEDWAWSSAAAHAGLRSGPLPVNLESLPAIAEE